MRRMSVTPKFPLHSDKDRVVGHEYIHQNYDNDALYKFVRRNDARNLGACQKTGRGIDCRKKRQEMPEPLQREP